VSSLIHELNNESLLLMYVAGELPGDDRAEVERMMASDAGLREQFEQIRTAYVGANDAIAGADRSERLALPAGAAARRVGQATRAWYARRVSLAAAAAGERGGRRGLRFPFWSYPMAAAAAIVLAAVSLWWFQAGRGPLRLDPLQNSPLVIDDGTSDEQPQALPPNPFGYGVVLPDPDEALDEVEDELYAMSEPVMDFGGILTLDETDAQ
jgi:anti-sigma factor RsiW